MNQSDPLKKEPGGQAPPGTLGGESLSDLQPPTGFDLRTLATRRSDTGISIDEDVGRFRSIVGGKSRDELRKYLERGERIIEKENGTFSLPIHQIEQPRFQHGSNEGGEGEGDGQTQGPARPDPSKKGKKGSKGGDESAEHPLEIGVTLEQLAEFLGDELGLPRIQPKGKSDLDSEGRRYTSVSRQGPSALKIFKRSFREALIRESASGEYDPHDPIVVPIRDDMRYRTAKPKPQPVDNAVIIHLMDVSGSMGTEQKDLARVVSFWTDTWIAGHYKQAVHIYIAHDTDAHVVDKETYYNQRENGGTKISSGYEKIIELMREQYPPESWNLYLFQYSDGDNLSSSDSQHCIELLKRDILPHINLFAYGQVKQSSGNGDYLKTLLESELVGDERVVLQEIAHRGVVKNAIQEFLKKGK